MGLHLDQSFLIVCMNCKLWHADENFTLTGSDLSTILEVGTLRSVAAVGLACPHFLYSSFVYLGSIFHLVYARARLSPSFIFKLINKVLPLIGLIPLWCGIFVIFLMLFDFLNNFCLFIHNNLIICDNLVADHLGCSFDNLP